jgi:hypothetical protein
MTIGASFAEPVACVGPSASFRSYGTTVRLEASDANLLAALRNTLPPFAQATDEAGREDLRLFVRTPGPCRCGLTHLTASLFRDRAFESAGSTDALVRLAGRIAKFSVAERADDRVFVHAGVVAWEGRVVVIPGRSMSGKTTLVRALVEAGAAYYSDEYAVIDQCGLIHPYPQPLGVRGPGAAIQQAIPIERLGYVAGTDPLRLAAVIVTAYVAGAPWNPAPLTRARAILELSQHAVPIARNPARVFDCLGAAIESAASFATARGEATPAARAILELVAKLDDRP